MPRGVTLRKRDPEEIDAAITMLVLCNGNAEEASRRLKEAGHSLSQDSIRRLPSLHLELYQQRRRELAPQIEEQLAAELLDNAAEASRATKQAIAKTVQGLENDTVEDTARAARELSQVMTQAIDKRLAIQGRPTQITEVRDVAEILRALSEKGIVTIIEADGIEDAEIVD
jgi:hypothetical protein